MQEEEKSRLLALCAELISAKQDEQKANDYRVSIEREIVNITGLPDEGSETHDAADYKVRVEQKINRKVDEKKWALISDQIPEAIRPISIVETIKVETAGVRWLKENEPGYYKLLCECMTESPAKPAVKVEVKK